MRAKHVILTAIVVLAVASITHADITGWMCAPDGDGAIDLKVDTDITWTETGTGEYEMSMQAVQTWGPAHMIGSFTNDDTDQAVRLIETIDNETSFAWTGYKFYIGLGQDFSINTSPSTITAPDGWTWTITQPTGPQLLPSGATGYLGLVDFSIGSGSAIAVGDSADFGLKFSWLPVEAGTVAFCTEQIPTPEPATMALLGLGGLLLRKRK